MNIIVDVFENVIYCTENTLEKNDSGVIEINSENERICEIPGTSNEIISVNEYPDDISTKSYAYKDGVFVARDFFSGYDEYISRIEFLNLMTTDERTLFRTSENLLISDFRYIIELSEKISLEDLRIQEAMYYMFLQGIFTEERLNFIFKNKEVFWTSIGG